MGKEIKTGGEQRQGKKGDTLINDNSEARQAAAEKAKSDLEVRAKAVGLKKSATEAEIQEAEFKAADEANKTEAARQDEMKEKSPKIWTLQNTINAAFAANALTNLPSLCETDVRALCGKVGASVNLGFNLNEDKTKGHITIKEFDVEARCPIEGEFDFGVDYTAIAKANQNRNEQDKEA